MLETALAGLFMIILVVVIHEAGHAIMARLFNIGVAEFGIGFGKPRIKLFRIRNIPVYFCLLLMGGYVRIKVKGDKKSLDAEGEFFEDASLPKKIMVLAAGISMNLILAIILRIAIFIGVPRGLKLAFFTQTITFSATPIWYLIPLAAAKSVTMLFLLWFKAISLAIFVFTPRFIYSIITGTIALKGGGGMIGTIALASVIHNGIWYYIAIVFYFSVLLASLNLVFIFPLDGGNIILAIAEKISGRLFRKNKIAERALLAFRYYGIIIIIALTLVVFCSDAIDIFHHFIK